tara:strand:- start:2030 stop:2416 length:387 start_codon:yes stop_codon:yes gene_type:complete
MKNNYIYLLFLIIASVFIIVRTPQYQKNDKVNNIQTLIRQAARWSAAAQQDDSPIIALLHANYGAGYLWALKDIANDKEIYDATGLDVLKFKKKIIDIQDNATKTVSRICSEFTSDIDKYLLRLGGDL